MEWEREENPNENGKINQTTNSRRSVDRVVQGSPRRSSRLDEDLRRMDALDHFRRLDDVVRSCPQLDVAPVRDTLARARRIPGGHRGDERGLRAVLGETLQTRTDLLDASVVEQPLRKLTGDDDKLVDALPDSLERRRAGAV